LIHPTIQQEHERLAKEALLKKQEFLQLQSQLNDAQALATETKREAEKLRKEAEDKEIQAAAAASIANAQQPAPPQPAAPTNVYGALNNGIQPTMLEQHKPPIYDVPGGAAAAMNGQPTEVVAGNGSAGYGGGDYSNGFNPSVMGGGNSLEISVPETNNLSAMGAGGNNFGTPMPESSNGYSPSVMGAGSGLEIPTPVATAGGAAADPYSNPFG